MAKEQPRVSEFANYAMEGLVFRRNKNNGFVVAELDFISDPAKRSAEWIENERRQMPPKVWAVEMLRSWETYAGRPVYEGAFHKHLHVLKTPREANPNYPIIRGWDFGGNQSCAIGQITKNQLIILDEMPNAGLNTRRFAPDVISFCNQTYGSNFVYIDIVDPSAAWEGKTAEGKACTDVMREFGLRPIAASTNDPQKRVESVIELLMQLNENGEPRLVLNPHCTWLIRGFEGGYHYPEKSSSAKKADRPEKNLFSHIHDGLQYAALRMKSYNNQMRADSDLAYERSLTRYNFGD